MLFGENRQKLHGKYGYPLSSVLTEMRDQFERNPELITVGMFFDPNRIHVMGPSASKRPAQFIEDHCRSRADKVPIPHHSVPYPLRSPVKVLRQLCRGSEELRQHEQSGSKPTAGGATRLGQINPPRPRSLRVAMTYKQFAPMGS